MSELNEDLKPTSVPILRRITPTELITFNNICGFKAENFVYPSIRELKNYLKTPASHVAVYYRLKNMVKKGYLKLNEQKKYQPTVEGLRQCIEDWSVIDRRLKRDKGTARHGAFKASSDASREDYQGELRELSSAPRNMETEPKTGQ